MNRANKNSTFVGDELSVSPIFIKENEMERFNQFSILKNNLKNRNFDSFGRLFMISESLKMFLVKKGFFMLDAYVVSWPACAKNLELTLVLATFVGPLVEL